MKTVMMLISATFFCFVMFSTALAQTPIAPPVTGAIGKVPTKEEVGVPVPPDTYYYNKSVGTSGEGKKIAIELLSKKTLKEASKFYFDKLDEMPGWRWSEDFSFDNYILFYNFDGEMHHPMDHDVSRIEIREVMQGYFDDVVPSDVMSMIKSYIVILYPSE